MKVVAAAGLSAYHIQPKEHIRILLLLLAGLYFSENNDCGLPVASKDDTIHTLMKIPKDYYGGKYTASKISDISKILKKRILKER